jgi:hypothetical protein
LHRPNPHIMTLICVPCIHAFRYASVIVRFRDTSARMRSQNGQVIERPAQRLLKPERAAYSAKDRPDMSLPCQFGDIRASAEHLAQGECTSECYELPGPSHHLWVLRQAFSRACRRTIRFCTHWLSRTQPATALPFAAVRLPAKAQLQPTERPQRRLPVLLDRAESSGIPLGMRRVRTVFPQAGQNPAQHTFDGVALREASFRRLGY